VQPTLEAFRGMSADESYTSKDLMTALRSVSEKDYADKVAPTELITSLCLFTVIMSITIDVFGRLLKL
jgi:hypothetical protein